MIGVLSIRTARLKLLVTDLISKNTLRVLNLIKSVIRVLTADDLDRIKSTGTYHSRLIDNLSVGVML